ncbi:MAG: double-stranded DNA-binding protein [Culicoidibacterales bacterium]
MSQETETEFNIGSDKSKLAGLLNEVSNEMTMIEAHRDVIKDLKDKAKELGIEPKVFTKLASMHHKRSREDFESETAELVDLYDATFKKLSTDDNE